AGVLGVDLNPIDALDPDARRWLEALVWPENLDRRALLAAALDVVAAAPPAIPRGDALDGLPRLTRPPPAGGPPGRVPAAPRLPRPRRSLGWVRGGLCLPCRGRPVVVAVRRGCPRPRRAPQSRPPRRCACVHPTARGAPSRWWKATCAGGETFTAG